MILRYWCLLRPEEFGWEVYRFCGENGKDLTPRPSPVYTLQRKEGRRALRPTGAREGKVWIPNICVWCGSCILKPQSQSNFGDKIAFS